MGGADSRAVRRRRRRGRARAQRCSSHLIATDGVGPLVDSLDDLDRLTAGGGIDLQVARVLSRARCEQASTAFGSAADDVDELDPSGYVDVLSERFADLSRAGRRCGHEPERRRDTAIQVLPDMLGAEGPRDYLLLFQNNAEIRATGGMPGSWALVHADDGRLEIDSPGHRRQLPDGRRAGAAAHRRRARALRAEIGTYFQDPGFTPDFPRAAELWNAHWEQVERRPRARRRARARPGRHVLPPGGDRTGDGR